MSRALPGARPSPNIWQHTATYEIENRAVDPHGRLEAAMSAVADWSGRTVLDIGCGTGFHLPRFAATAASVVGVEPHADLVALARRRTRALAERDRQPGDRAVAAGPGRVGRRRPRPLGVLLRPGLRARPGRAATASYAAGAPRS